MFRQIAAIVIIFFCAAVAWSILGTTIFHRTYSFDESLKGRVASIWGAPHVQMPPKASTTKETSRKVESIENGKTVVRTEKDYIVKALDLEGSKIAVGLDLDHRQKGLLWYSTYKVAFAGDFLFRNTTDEEAVDLVVGLPTPQASYDEVTVAVNGQAVSFTNEKSSLRAAVHIAKGHTAVVTVKYRSQGLDSWRYHFGGEVAQVRNFELKMTTNFKDIDFPDNTLAPAVKTEKDNGWELTWESKNMLSGFQIGMILPEKLQPGPLAGRISYFAPVSLLFFFFLMFIITTIRGIDLHPMNYFFLACAFFAFHLLLAYLVDHISIHVAFIVCSLVSLGLVISYLRLVVGLRFAAVEAGLAQLIYLVLFSYAFFFKGFSGLAVTTGSIITLFIVMQMTARIRWSENFAKKTTVRAHAG
ncbi:MAG TPA: inner membrane CreD family protein [Candidatus Binatia bacterium]|nr:inner membrane CreD family protein [Candidatus Binatia bacterium]